MSPQDFTEVTEVVIRVGDREVARWKVSELEKELARVLLKPPLRLLGVTTPGNLPLSILQGPWAGGAFSTLEEAMAEFRCRRPEGRWLVWLQGVDGETVGIDSQKWDLAKEGAVS